MATRSSNGPWIEEWLSIGRFSTYLAAAGGSRSRALDLYDWNAKLSAAFLHDLSHLEVGLRNACDRQLAAATLPGDAHWTDPATLLTLFPVLMRRDRSTGRARDVNKIARGNVERARLNATKVSDAPLIPGKVVAELMFGFWTYLFADAQEKPSGFPIFTKHSHRASIEIDSTTRWPRFGTSATGSRITRTFLAALKMNGAELSSSSA